MQITNEFDAEIFLASDLRVYFDNLTIEERKWILDGGHYTTKTNYSADCIDSKVVMMKPSKLMPVGHFKGFHLLCKAAYNKQSPSIKNSVGLLCCASNLGLVQGEFDVENAVMHIGNIRDKKTVDIDTKCSIDPAEVAQVLKLQAEPVCKTARVLLMQTAVVYDFKAAQLSTVLNNGDDNFNKGIVKADVWTNFASYLSRFKDIKTSECYAAFEALMSDPKYHRNIFTLKSAGMSYWKKFPRDYEFNVHLKMITTLAAYESNLKAIPSRIVKFSRFSDIPHQSFNAPIKWKMNFELLGIQLDGSHLVDYYGAKGGRAYNVIRKLGNVRCYDLTSVKVPELNKATPDALKKIYAIQFPTCSVGNIFEHNKLERLYDFERKEKQAGRDDMDAPEKTEVLHKTSDLFISDVYTTSAIEQLSLCEYVNDHSIIKFAHSFSSYLDGFKSFKFQYPIFVLRTGRPTSSEIFLTGMKPLKVDNHRCFEVKDASEWEPTLIRIANKALNNLIKFCYLAVSPPGAMPNLERREVILNYDEFPFLMVGSKHLAGRDASFDVTEVLISLENVGKFKVDIEKLFDEIRTADDRPTLDEFGKSPEPLVTNNPKIKKEVIFDKSDFDD